MRFYAELATAHGPAVSFPAPTSVPRISSRPANPIAEWMANGRVHNIRFNSSFEAVNPALRDQCRGYERNNVVHAQHWRHDDGPHPTLCVIHGFMGSAYLLNGLFFSLPWFYRSGYDVLLYTLPFHGRRAEKYSPFSGYGYFAHGMSGFAEAMAQAVHDFRSLEPHELEASRQRRRETQAIVVRILGQGIERGQIRRVDPTLVAMAVFSITNWAVEWYDPAGPMSAEEAAAFFADLLVDGLADSTTR